MQCINSKPPVLSNFRNSAMRACLNSSEEHSTSGMQMVLSPRPALTSFSFSSTVQGTLQRFCLPNKQILLTSFAAFPFLKAGKNENDHPSSSFLAHLGRVQSLHAASAQLPPFCLRYNLSAAVVHGHFEVQLQLDYMHLKCLNLQCVDKHFTDGKT